MKTFITIAVLSITSFSFAQDCCNVIDQKNANIVTQNGNCVQTLSTKNNCNNTYLAMAYIEPKLSPSEVEILNNALKGVKFKTNSDELLHNSFIKLDRVADLLNKHPDFMLIINGYTDNTGTSEYNHKLSHDRAKSAKNHLVNVDKIKSSRIITKGYGEENPIATNQTEKGKSKNRRVEFKAYSKK